jgi:hypothetical protein
MKTKIEFINRIIRNDIETTGTCRARCCTPPLLFLIRSFWAGSVHQSFMSL